jgi:hypothetical protein
MTLTREISISLLIPLAFFLIAFSLLSSLPFVYAQNREEALQNQIFIAKSAFGLDETEENKAELLSSYEGYLEQICMRSLSVSKDYFPMQLSTRCDEYIDVLLKLDSGNAVAICTRDGIDATSCRRAYTYQSIKIRSGSSLKNLPKEDSKRTRRGFESSELRKARLDFENEASAEHARALESVFQKNLIDHCQNIETQRVPAKELIRIERSKEPTNKAEEAIEQYLIERGELAPPEEAHDEQNDKNQLFRVRALPSKCFENIKKLLEYYPDSPLALCYRDGFFSPSCVDARRRDEQRFSSPTGPGSSTPSSNSSVGRF